MRLRLLRAGVSLAVTLLALAGSGCQPTPAPDDLRLVLFNPHAEQWIDAPVIMRLEHYHVPLAPHARVYRQHGNVEREIPSQLDDLDGDGTADQLFFLINLEANETARLIVRRDSVPVILPRRADLPLDALESVDVTDPAVVESSHALRLDDADSVAIEMVADGPLRTLVRKQYHGVISDGSSVDVLVERERHAGSDWIHQRVMVDDAFVGRQITAGIPRLGETSRLESGTFSGVFSLYTARATQSEERFVGAALLVPERLRPRMEPNGPDHRVQFEAENQRASYRFRIGESAAPGTEAASTSQAFQKEIVREALRWMNPIQVSVAR